MLRANGVNLVGAQWIACTAIHIGPGCAVDHHLRARSRHGVKGGLQLADIAFRQVTAAHLRCRPAFGQRSAKLAADTGNEDVQLEDPVAVH